MSGDPLKLETRALPRIPVRSWLETEPEVRFFTESRAKWRAPWLCFPRTLVVRGLLRSVRPEMRFKAQAGKVRFRNDYFNEAGQYPDGHDTRKPHHRGHDISKRG